MLYLKKLSLLTIFFIFFLTGCVHQVDKKGITLSLSENQLSNSFANSFPYEKDFVFGGISINSPKIKMSKTTNRIDADIKLKFKTLFTNSLTGKFSISGEPAFNKKEHSVYLQNVQLKEFGFGQLKMSEDFTKTFIAALQPMVQELFKKFPIYKIPQESIHGSFINNVKVAESKLLITYGL